jgi:hypothetical protein
MVLLSTSIFIIIKVASSRFLSNAAKAIAAPVNVKGWKVAQIKGGSIAKAEASAVERCRRLRQSETIAEVR